MWRVRKSKIHGSGVFASKLIPKNANFLHSDIADEIKISQLLRRWLNQIYRQVVMGQWL